MGETDGAALAIVAFETDFRYLTEEQRWLAFGRAADCPVRFGHQPLPDTGVSRVAGAVGVCGERVVVENLSDTIGFDVKTPEGPREVVRPGVLLGPAGNQFEIHYQGSSEAEYLIAVQRLTEPRPVPPPIVVTVDDEPSTDVRPDLDTREWQVLEALAEPLRLGGTARATYGEVRERLNWSVPTIRVDCNRIRAKFRLAGVPVRRFPDPVDAIVDAALRHRLVPPATGEQHHDPPT